MASVDNRSNIVISVPRHPGLTKTFSYDQPKKAKAYFQSLQAQGHKPDIAQLEDSIQVRVRRVGQKDQYETFGSIAEADAFVKRIESEQQQGLFIDYTSAANVTFAEIIERYIEEECPSHKGGANYAIMLRAILADSKHELKKRIELRKSEMREFGEIRTPLGANREPMNALEWVQLPFAKITSDHINDFVEDRSQYVAPASVDRQLDLLSSVVNTALIRWGYHLERSPMAGVKRPQYFNDRTRRVSDEEEALLLAAARQEDQLRSLELHVQTLAEDQLKRAKDLTTHYSRNDRRKTALLEARRKAVTEGFPHIPMYETFVQFQLATAARRGEALGLFWDRMNFKAQTAYLPTSKNGKPRTLYVRTEILELIQKLPRDSDVVFDITIKNLQGAWDRICEAAGIEDLHIHDLRHEGISRAVESGMFPTVLDLQAYSGHRDVRSLVRYYHPASDVMNGRLEAAEKLRQEKLGAEGRARLQASALMVDNVPVQTKATSAPAQDAEQSVAESTVQTPLSALVDSVEATDSPLPSNVTRLKLPPQRWANAAVAPQSVTN